MFRELAMQTGTFLLLAFPALFSIINPLGGAFVFLAATQGIGQEARTRLARRVALYSFITLNASMLIGAYVLRIFGISMPGMRIAGGMIVAFLGFRMLFPAAPAVATEVAAQGEVKYDIAFTPLAMPGLSGPGTFAVVMSLSSQATSREGWDRVADFLGVATGILLVAVLSWFALRGAERFNRILGATGVVTPTHLMRLLISYIGL